MLLRCTFLFLASAAIAASAQSQNSPVLPTPSLKTRVRLVVVDVVATNRKGEPVPGLKKEDFEILENGKPQTVSVFEEHKGAPPKQLKLPSMPPNVYTNFPVTLAADSINVILLDAVNTPASDQSYVHSQMLKYLQTIPPGTRVAIFTLASRLRMLQGITTDSTQLLAAINSGKANPRRSAFRPSAESDVDQGLIDILTS